MITYRIYNNNKVILFINKCLSLQDQFVTSISRCTLNQVLASTIRSVTLATSLNNLTYTIYIISFAIGHISARLLRLRVVVSHRPLFYNITLKKSHLHCFIFRVILRNANLYNFVLLIYLLCTITLQIYDPLNMLRTSYSDTKYILLY